MVDIETYEYWVSTRDLSVEEINEDLQSADFSVDLEEATYRLPFEVLQSHCEVIDLILSDFTPWKVFRSLFSSFEREIDLTELVKKGYVPNQEHNKLTTTCGSFMGDGMSFAHLTMFQLGLANYAMVKSKARTRPLGQSVGDDLLVLRAGKLYADQFIEQATKLNAKFSKLNSISTDSNMFCEKYSARVKDIESFQDMKDMVGSVFGDIVFLDIITGSLLCGQSKVKSNGDSPFFGHAVMLGKQLAWHPIAFVRKRAPVFLWASNYKDAKKLSGLLASLPRPLGGMELGIGTQLRYENPRYQEVHKYFEGMLNLPLSKFLKYYLLLQGIYRANPKGVPWENDPELIGAVMSSVNVREIKDLSTILPDFLAEKSWSEKHSYIKNELNLISIDYLINHLARQDAFLKQWEMLTISPYMTLQCKNIRARTNKVIAILKSDITPVEPENFRFRSIAKLANEFNNRLWGLYINKDDPALINAFKGMPRLVFSIN
jgi:hypothetical protein